MSGGKGGNADAVGDDSSATGGPGGSGASGNGGDGGNAYAGGHRSIAIGGPGGPGGLTNGMRGQDAIAHGNGVCVAGGGGGGSSQVDGGGGVGGVPGQPLNSPAFTEFDRRLMKRPWGKPNDEPGRGGDSDESPLYFSRKKIILGLKKIYFETKGIQETDPDHIWYDRVIVPLEWLNGCLALRRYKWRVSIVEREYFFTDL